MFYKKGVLKIFTKFTEKQLRQSLYFNKVAGLRLATLLKKRLWHRCFPMNFVKFLRTPFLQNTSGRLLLFLTYHSCLCHSFMGPASVDIAVVSLNKYFLMDNMRVVSRTHTNMPHGQLWKHCALLMLENAPP